jgi:hypothetical protein
MEATAWNNGSYHDTGAGYGLKIDIVDRDKYFRKEWKYILLSLPGSKKEIKINTGKASFWNQSCRELISQDIGKWLIQNNFAPWVVGKPPKFVLEHLDSNRFSLKV